MKCWIKAADGYYDLYWTTTSGPATNILVDPGPPVVVAASVTNPEPRPES